MKNIIVMCDYPLIYKALKSKTEFYKISIVYEKLKLDKTELLKYFDRVIEVKDIYDKIEIENVITEIIDDPKENIEAIYSPFEGTVEVAGYLREKFGLKGNGEETSQLVRNKYLMKKKLQETGIKINESSIINSMQDIELFISKHGYPVILKPISGYATINTFKINNEDDLKAICGEITLDEEKNKEKGKYIVETFITGEEYCCDSVVQNGKVVFASVCKYLANCIDIIEHNSPNAGIVHPENSHNNVIVEKIKELNQKVISALNINNTVCHLEVFVDNDSNISFGEIAARIGGGSIIPPCIKNTYNLDIFDAYVDVHLDRLNLDMVKSKNKYTGYLGFPTKVGKIKEISKEEDYKNDESVVYVKIFNKAGDIIGDQDNTADKTGVIIMEDENYENLKCKLENAFNNFKLTIEK